MMKGVVFSLFGLILLMCACGNSQTKQDRGKATVPVSYTHLANDKKWRQPGTSHFRDPALCHDTLVG